jgi:deoxycytidine triphosphate deaminase
VTYDEKVLWTDPVPEPMRVGVLQADQILLFVEAVHLIEPSDFLREDLRPAAYDLHIGDMYYVDDEPKPLGPGEWFNIPANGLVYVKTKERFNIPYYMVARYSLRVTQVYRGLLIDNGLHIDPGYHGPIYVPVHNFTDQERSLFESQSFLSIEFARTTPLPVAALQRVGTEAEFVTKYGKGGLVGVNGYEAILFNKGPDDLRRQPRTPKDFWNKFPGEKHKSAMMATEGRLKEVRDGVADQLRRSEDRIRNVGFGAALAIMVALLAIILPWISARYLDTERAYNESARKLQALSDQVQDLKNQPLARPIAPTPQPGPPAAPVK